MRIAGVPPTHHFPRAAPSRQRRIRPWVTNLTVVLVATIVALLLGEAGLRIRSAGETSLEGLFRGDSELGVALTPGYEGGEKTSEFEYNVRINSLGIRDNPVLPKVPGVHRILVLGDSFTFGSGVPLEFSYPKLMEHYLNAADDGRRFEVINAGAPGYGPFHESYMLERLMEPVTPDVVVLGFFVGNDFTDNYRRPSPEESRKTLRGFLWLHSALFRFVNRYAPLPGRRASYDIHRDKPSDETLATIEEAYKFVLEIGQRCAASGVEFLVVVIPRFTQVHPDAWNKAVTVYRLPPEDYNLEEPNRRLGDMLNRKQIRTLNLLRPLRQAVRTKELYFEQDGHWNREGNSFVASIIAKTLLASSHGEGRRVEY